jgi:hypothetical protein
MELSLNLTQNGSRTLSRARFSNNDGSHPRRAAVRKQLCQGLRQPVFLFDVPLIRFLACVDPFLWNKSPHRWSHLRPPPDPRHLPRPPALRNANNIHRRVSLIAIHVAHPPACSSRGPRIPATTTINAPPEPGRSTHIPCAARRSSSTTPTSQNQGRGPTPLAEDRDGLETRDAGEYCSSTHDRELRRQETCNGSAGTGAEHADERKDGEKTQQSRAASVVFRSPVIASGIYVSHPTVVYTKLHFFTSYRTDCTPYPYRATP